MNSALISVKESSRSFLHGVRESGHIGQARRPCRVYNDAQHLYYATDLQRIVIHLLRGSHIAN